MRYSLFFIEQSGLNCYEVAVETRRYPHYYKQVVIAHAPVDLGIKNRRASSKMLCVTTIAVSILRQVFIINSWNMVAKLAIENGFVCYKYCIKR